MESHKFSFYFDSNKLLQDLRMCQSIQWPLHFNKNDFTGHWSSFALRSISGKELDILATPNAIYNDTPTLNKCKYFLEIINYFKCPKEAVRLLSLSPNSFIKEHSDNAAGYSDGFFRIHVPILTNPEVVFRLNGKILPMQVGECWYADFNLPHFVSNEGNSDRIHLVIDCIRNKWSDALFAEIGFDFENEKKVKYDKKTKLMMIEQLSFMQTETAEIMIKKLREEML
ncbi:aspartyl/asparaginyl beta-hydroxylase domain-containing protein [Lacihabitans sp. LS3-19]|uniref:aspartyl/asparaginyl beta-hydroxylase domain-containing protein n=1 Tax=Lacihabitans sp. LS3-19 TaxID=2487335 RepID=UPI0020CB7D84|nr:aspartyl/asparaginyl beta-hydroxylase domain-containing protein [Lacihabitans sp. LS3-19]MCP9770168.1 aspartyl/asparaginyl beta-hydroxylase domain-containing protein [Lacihabitans sp. LS3-19]